MTVSAILLLIVLLATVYPTEENNTQSQGVAKTIACDRYAAVDGSDNAEGTKSEPFQTAQKLANSLSPGETGCLRSGTYTEPDETLTISSGGDSGRRMVLSSAPGEQATFVGRLYITEEADYVTVRDLVLDGMKAPKGSSGGTLPSPTVNGDYATFFGNEVTNRHRGICFNVGHSPSLAEHTLIRNNRIHDCGRLPRTNHDHGIYLSAAKDTIVVDNLIYNNADRGIQLYPDAEGTLIEGNVIDGNGQGIVFSGRGKRVSSNNTVHNNVISNSQAGWNVFGNWNQTNKIGHNNAVYDNCVWASDEQSNGGISPEERGFKAHDNLVAKPAYVDSEADNFKLSDNSRCKTVLDGKTRLLRGLTS